MINPEETLFRVNSLFMIWIPGLSRSLQPFYEAGSCQEEFGVLIGSPFYSSFHRYLARANRFVVSFNGATSLILGYEFSTQGCHEFLVISISFRTHPFSHSSLTRPSCQ